MSGMGDKSADKMLKIASRTSELAMAQSLEVKAMLEQAHEGLVCEASLKNSCWNSCAPCTYVSLCHLPFLPQIIGVSTKGDQKLDRPLHELGDKVFIANIQQFVNDSPAKGTVHGRARVNATERGGRHCSALA